MKFSIDKNLIINEFQSLAAVADKKQTLPILSNILIRCEEDKVKLSKHGSRGGIRGCY
jgi:DNA polymerase sliding clamp subunit (PCNA homolog)